MEWFAEMGMVVLLKQRTVHFNGYHDVVLGGDALINVICKESPMRIEVEVNVEDLWSLFAPK